MDFVMSCCTETMAGLINDFSEINTVKDEVSKLCDCGRWIRLNPKDLEGEIQ